MSYKKILNIEKRLPEGHHIYYNERRLTEEDFESLSNTRLTSDLDVAPIIDIRTKKEKICGAHIAEAFECCAKTYLFGFFGTALLEPLLSVAVELSHQLGYSYAGYTHVKGHASIKAGKLCGFETLISYKNKRSGNILNELAHII